MLNLSISAQCTKYSDHYRHPSAPQGLCGHTAASRLIRWAYRIPSFLRVMYPARPIHAAVSHSNATAPHHNMIKSPSSIGRAPGSSRGPCAYAEVLKRYLAVNAASLSIEE